MMAGTDGALCRERGCSIAIYPPSDAQPWATLEHRSAPVWHVRVDLAFCNPDGRIAPDLMLYLDRRARAIHDRGGIIVSPDIPVLEGLS